MILGLGTPQYHPQELSPALTVTVQTQDWTTEELKQLAVSIANAHNLNASHFIDVIQKESQWDIYAKGDYPDGKGNYVTAEYAPPGSEPTSFGLCQLHFPSRDWGIATSTAYDPEVCLEIMGEQWEEGNASKWSAFTYYQKHGWPSIL